MNFKIWFSAVQFSIAFISIAAVMPSVSLAYETRIEVIQQYKTDGLGTDLKTCQTSADFTQAYCYYYYPSGGLGSSLPSDGGIMISFPFNLGVEQYQNSTDGTVQLLGIWGSTSSERSTPSGLSDGDVTKFRLYYNYDTEVFSLKRTIYYETNYKEIEYKILDELIDLDLTGIDPNIENMFYYQMKLYVTEDFMWFEVYDRSDPFFAPRYVSPTFFGIGNFLRSYISQSDAFRYWIVTASPIDDKSDFDNSIINDPPVKLNGKDELVISTFDYDDLVDDIGTNYSALPDAPLREMLRMAPALLAVILN